MYCQVISQISTLTYINVSDDYGVAVAIEKVVSLGVSIDDNGHPTLGVWQCRKYPLCTEKIISWEDYPKR